MIVEATEVDIETIIELESHKGYCLIRLDFKSHVFELRRISISHKGMGYGKETMLVLFKYAFEELDIFII